MGVFAETDPVALRRLRWRSRRGLLENDIILTRFFERHAGQLDDDAVIALEDLLELPDNELLDLLLARAALPAELDRAPVRALLDLIRMH